MLEFGFYNMDCIEGMKQFPDKYFDLAIVDPVYGDATKGGWNRNQVGKRKHRHDYYTALWNQEKTGAEYFKELLRVSKNQIIWGGNYFADNLPTSQGWICWDKLRGDGVSFADCELAYTSFNCAARMFRYKWNGFMQQDMKNKEYRIHPTQKPVALYEWLLLNYSNEGDIILDTHTGSASSLIACHHLQHDYVAFEIDPVYYEMAKKRLETELAQKTIFDY